VPAADPAEAWPDWLRDKIAADWPEQAAGILPPAQAAPQGCASTAARRARHARLEAAGIAAVAMDGWPDALRIDVPVAMSALPGFADGDVPCRTRRRGRGAAAACRARALDACRAGGKAAHLLEREPGCG
jgi:16S rRNA (cytosine967-C5)-methyltransferase